MADLLGSKEATNAALIGIALAALGALCIAVVGFTLTVVLDPPSINVTSGHDGITGATSYQIPTRPFLLGLTICASLVAFLAVHSRQQLVTQRLLDIDERAKSRASLSTNLRLLTTAASWNDELKGDKNVDLRKAIVTELLRDVNAHMAKR